MIKEKIPQLETLSPGEKLALVSELWDDLASHGEQIPVTPQQLAELERRLKEYREHPDRVTSWEEAKTRILSSR